MHRTTASAGAIVACLVSGSAPQAQAPAGPRFEVASVRRSMSNAPGFTMAPSPGGRFTATNVPLRFLVTAALRVPNYRLDGGPDWISSERYDIQATADPAAAPQWPDMLRSLLVDRFKLATHTERRSRQGFALLRDRSDGRLGDRLRWTVECETAPSLPPCGQARGSDHSYQMNRLPLSMLVTMLTQRVGGPVEDRTGLTGSFVVQLDWAPERRPGSPDAVPDDGVVLFTALQEQLGLKLQREPLDVDVIVIDRIERPPPD
jgi:uncharacterized protein (TIGR03435 family)